MKLSLLLITIIIPTFLMAQLEPHRWQDRVILLFADTDQQKEFQEQWQELKLDTAGLQERDLIVYHVFRDKVRDEKLNIDRSIHLHKRYNLDNISFKFVLIGKDGGVKAEQRTPISRKELFALIDGMPMRRAEIRRKPKSGRH